MEINIGMWDLVKLGVKLVNHKIIQYRLGTNDTEVLSTHYGQVKGLKRKNIYEDVEPYYAFEGIPYAKPPVGELRFRAPQPVEPWTGILDCTQYRDKPMQKHFALKRIEGDENCLHLNVYVKKLKTEKPLPVLVWIYGGGFQVGEATRDIYAPDYFMKEDVVLVVINYRLGALGFLSLSDPDLGVPGNAGLKDQVMALRWIKSNIAHFNGDCNNITVFGESAGGASTHLMMLTDQTRGLFHKAILQSGNAMCPWADTPDHEFGFRLAQQLGYTGGNNDKEVFRFLSKVEARHIANSDNNILTLDEKRNHLLIAFGPVVEPYTSEHCITCRPFKELLQSAWSNEIPIILGGTSFEGLFSFQSTKLLRNLGDCENILPDDVRTERTKAELKEMGRQLRAVHFGDSEASFDKSKLLYLDLLSFKYFWHGINRTLHARLAYAPNAATYLYRFDMDSPDFNHYRVLKCGREQRGVSHADDLSYLFYNITARKLPKSSAEYKTIERMIGMWTAFAVTSNPNCSAISPAVWAPVERGVVGRDSAPKCLNISAEVEFIDFPEQRKLDAWKGLYTRVTLY